MSELRFLPAQAMLEHRGGSPKIVGYAAVFNSPSEPIPIGNRDKGFREIIRPGAFAESLRSTSPIFALLEHSQTAVLGSTQSGTLRLYEDRRGLRYEIDPPNTEAGRDAVELIRRRDIQGSSFSFSVRSGGETWRRDSGQLVRELRSLKLHHVSPVTRPAYAATEAALRSLAEWQKSTGADDKPWELQWRLMRLALAERM
jgi:HK97 family phage prohead protease